MKIYRSAKIAASANRQRQVSEPDGVQYYAVSYRDMAKAYIHLLGFDTKDEAISAYQALSRLEYAEDLDEFEYEDTVNEVFSMAVDTADEIDYRNDIEKYGSMSVYTDPNTGYRWLIVNPRGIWIDLYV